MSGAIAIFVKTPGFSPIKTRLAVNLGQEAAEAFHIHSARAITETVKSITSEDIKGYFAVAEQAALNHEYWQNLPCIWQGEGGLGERMEHIYQVLLSHHDFVILVGSDIPQLTTTDLQEASAWLPHNEQARLAFGPSFDGGFWLFGGNCRVPQNVWTDVVYSAEDTGAQFFNHIKQVGDIKTLTLLRDVDTGDDLFPLRESLLELKQPLPAQQELLQFLETLTVVN